MSFLIGEMMLKYPGREIARFLSSFNRDRIPRSIHISILFKLFQLLTKERRVLHIFGEFRQTHIRMITAEIINQPPKEFFVCFTQPVPNDFDFSSIIRIPETIMADLMP